MAAAAVGLLAAGALLALSLPIVSAASAARPGDTIARDLRARADLDEEQMLTLVSSRSRAIARFGALDWRRELATVSVMVRGDKPVDVEAIERSRIQTVKALEEGPASPQDWLRLSILETMKDERPAAVRHLSAALLTGADMPRLRWGVLDVGLDLWRDLPPDLRRSTLVALRNTWRGGDKRERHGLLVYLRARGFLPLAAMVLADEEGLQEEIARL
jgi:hypothetical protein